MEVRELSNGTQFVCRGYVYEKVGDQFINGTLDCTLVRVTREGVEMYGTPLGGPSNMNPYANVTTIDKE